MDRSTYETTAHDVDIIRPYLLQNGNHHSARYNRHTAMGIPGKVWDAMIRSQLVQPEKGWIRRGDTQPTATPDDSHYGISPRQQGYQRNQHHYRGNPDDDDPSDPSDNTSDLSDRSYHYRQGHNRTHLPQPHRNR